MNMAKPIDLIARYIELRTQLREADKKYDAFKKKHYDDPMKEIEQHFVALLEETGSDSMKTRSGTVYKQMNASVTTADGGALRQYVIDNGLWELVDWRPNKTQVTEIVERGEPLPPGVNFRTFQSIHFRAPKE